MSCVVRIRGLPYSARADDIIEFFKDVNISGGKRGIYFPQGPNGRSNGEAFIELESEDEIDKATSHHNEHMGRRYIEVFRSSREELDNAMGRESRYSYRKEYVVRLRGLPYDTEKKEIYAFFNGLEIAPNGIGLLVDHMGRCTGEAYVQFTSAEMLARAKEKHMEKIGHRYIEIFESSMSEANATIQRQMEANRRSGVGPMMGRSGRDSYNGGPASYYGPPKGYGPPPVGHGYGRGPPSGRPGPYARPMPPNHPGGYGSPPRGMSGPSPKAPSYASMTNPEPEDSLSMTGHSIRLRGLPYSATNEDIHRFLSPLQPVNIRIHMNSNGRPTGEAVVDFASHDEAKEAMKKDREKIGSRYIELFFASTPMGSSSRMSSGGPSYGRQYGPPSPPPYGGGGSGRMLPMNDGYGGDEYGAMRGQGDMNYDSYYNGGMGMEGDVYPDYRSGYRQPNYHWS